ncbi:MAG TPA: hypothetical protein VF710_19135 [Longimicrobium sp.]|jgi:uncharacterized membrane protein
MRRQRTRILPLLVLLAALLPSAVTAQAASLRGNWNINRQQSDNLENAINRAVARMNLVVRQIARPRLRSTNTMYPSITMSYDQSSVRVDMAGRPSVSSPANGQPVLWQRQTGGTCREMKGDCVRVSAEWDGGNLKHTFQAEDGRRVNVYSVSPDGKTMTMNVTVTSPRLPQPLTYKLVYNRAT